MGTGEQHICFGQTISGNPGHNNEIKRRTGIESIWETWRYYEHQHIAIFEEKGVQPASPSNFTLRLRILTSHRRTRKKTKKQIKRNGEENDRCFVERQGNVVKVKVRIFLRRLGERHGCGQTIPCVELTINGQKRATVW